MAKVKDLDYRTRTKEYHVNFILQNLGLDATKLEGKHLDIGCGINANLVNYLRTIGIDSDGIDPELSQELAGETFLMKVSGTNIPQPDNSYDLVTTHVSFSQYGIKYANDTVTIALPNRMIIRKDDQSPFLDEARKTLYEGLRVLKPEKAFLLYPDPSYLLNEVREDLSRRGVEIIRKEIEIDPYDKRKFMRSTSLEDFLYRAILIKHA